MSTLPAIRNRVLKKLREDDSRRPLIGIVECDQAICDAYNLELARLPGLSIETTGGLTLTANADTFSLPATRTYKGEVRIRLQRDGTFLNRRTYDEMDALRRGTTTPMYGVPTDFALWEGSDLVLNGRTYPGSLSAWVCDLFTTSLPSDPRVAADLEAVSLVGLSAAGESALVLKVAAQLGRTLPRQAREERGLDREAFADWQAEASKGFYVEELRHSNLESVSRVQRRVR